MEEAIVLTYDISADDFTRAGEASSDVKRKLKQMGVKAGIPDLCLPVPMGMYNGLYIEMKYDTGRLEDSQKKMLKALAAAGHYCTVCYGAEEAIRVLQEYINLKKIDAGKREDTMSEQNLMIRKNGKVKCIIFKE